MRRLKLEVPVLQVVESLLGGQRPTAKRLLTLLGELTQRRARMEEAKMPLDEQDVDLGRTPYRARAHAEQLNPDPANLDAALGNLTDAEQRRAATSRERLNDTIAANEARGLHRTAPPIEEDPAVVDPERPNQPTSDPAVSDPPIDRGGGPSTTSPAQLEVDEIERRKTAGIRRTREVAEGLERGVLQRMPTLGLQGRSLKTLEGAAEVLIAELQPNHQDAIRQVAREYQMDAWVVILGAVARMADLQELHAGEFEDHWKNRQGSGATPASAKAEICQMCGGEMPPDPVRRNRQFCCNRHGSEQIEHTEGCALASRKMVTGAWVTVRA